MEMDQFFFKQAEDILRNCVYLSIRNGGKQYCIFSLCCPRLVLRDPGRLLTDLHSEEDFASRRSFACLNFGNSLWVSQQLHSFLCFLHEKQKADCRSVCAALWITPVFTRPRHAWWPCNSIFYLKTVTGGGGSLFGFL